MATSEKFRLLLEHGDLRTIADVEKIRALVTNATDFRNLLQLIESANRNLAMKAADAAEKISREKPGWVNGFKSQLLTHLNNKEHKELLWHVLQLLRLCDFSSAEATDLQPSIRELIESYPSNIVKAESAEFLFYLSLKNPVLGSEVRSYLDDLLHDEQSPPALKSRIRKILSKKHLNAKEK